MSTHLSRKELKQDNVALKVEETTHFLVTHREQATKIGVITLIVLAVGFGAWFFMTSRRDARQQALAAAITLQSAPVGAASPNGGPIYPTEQAKSEAVRRAFNTIISEDGGSQEAYAAEYYLAGTNAAAGKTDDALKEYDHVASNAGPDFASLAKLAKAQVLFSLNRSPEAQTLLRDLIANPTAMVSKEQASLALAEALAPTQPEEARKLLLPIASERSDVSQIAVSALSDLPAGK